MADDENIAAKKERRNALQQERRGLKKTERKANRQEIVRRAQLKALKRVQKESGRAGKIIGGTMADVGAQAPIAVGRGALEAGEKALDVVTGGAYTPIDVATTVGGSVFQKGAGKAAKYGIGRPLGKQAGKAPYRPAVAIQKRRVKAAKKRGARAKAEGKEVSKELAQSKNASEKLLGVLIKGLSAVTIKVAMIPVELALALLIAIFLPMLVLLLGLFVVLYITVIDPPGVLGVVKDVADSVF